MANASISQIKVGDVTYDIQDARLNDNLLSTEQDSKTGITAAKNAETSVSWTLTSAPTSNSTLLGIVGAIVSGTGSSGVLIKEWTFNKENKTVTVTLRSLNATTDLTNLTVAVRCLWYK